MMGKAIKHGLRIVVVAGGVLVGVRPVVAGDVAAGKSLYEKQCKVCHSIAGVAGPKADVGGPLDGVGTKRDEAFVRAYMKDPKSKIPDAKMPKMRLSDEDFENAIAFMMSLK